MSRTKCLAIDQLYTATVFMLVLLIITVPRRRIQGTEMEVKILD